jgi:hypothetical protein
MTKGLKRLKAELKQRKEDLKAYYKYYEEGAAKADKATEILDAYHMKNPHVSYSSENYDRQATEIALLEQNQSYASKEAYHCAEAISNIGSDVTDLEKAIADLKDRARLEKENLNRDQEIRLAVAANQEAQAQRDHEREMAKFELMKLKEQRLAHQAARDAAALAKAQENDQFAAILKSLKGDDES